MLTVSAFIFSLLLIMGWIGQESQIYNEVIHYQRQLQTYHDHCLKMDSEEKSDHLTCPFGFILLRGRCSRCPQGTFNLLHWASCAKFLTCDGIMMDLRPTNVLWQTGRWKYFIANWNTFRVMYAQKIGVLGNYSSHNFENTWGTAVELSPYHSFLYPIGLCADTDTIVYGLKDEIFPLTQLDSILNRNNCNNWVVRFKLAMDYVRLLQYLHLHPSGPYILCNSHSLNTLISQFAISDHLELLLTNFENIPAGNQPIVCSQKELHGKFIAPEQSWPFSHYKMFNPDDQPGYFYTTDIWKVPDVTQYFLGTSKESEKVLNYLVLIHRKCKSKDYLQRPSVKEILKEYETIWTIMLDGSPYHTSSTDNMSPHDRLSGITLIV